MTRFPGQSVLSVCRAYYKSFFFSRIRKLNYCEPLLILATFFLSCFSGKFGIWLDGDLYQGRTESCTTFGNEPLVPQQDFVVKTLECWAFL